MPVNESDIEKAYKAALAARKNAHAPYSKFQVGAAVKLEGIEEISLGCNVENANGTSICAERNALAQAIVRHGRSATPEFVMIVTGETQATVPCGACLQVMAEFCGDDMPVYLANTKGVFKHYKLIELLPFPFRAYQPGDA